MEIGNKTCSYRAIFTNVSIAGGHKLFVSCAGSFLFFTLLDMCKRQRGERWKRCRDSLKGDDSVTVFSIMLGFV